MENIFKEKMDKNFPNAGREMDIQIHEAQGAQNRRSLHKAALGYVTLKWAKVKDKDFESRKTRKSSIQGIPIKLWVDFSTETCQARREWDDIVNILKGKKKTFQTGILCLAKLSFRNEGERYS